MKVEVVHVKDYGKESRYIGDDMYLYCGRGSRYGNPHVMKHEGERNTVIEAYKKDEECQKEVSYLIGWFNNRVSRGDIDVVSVKTLKLGCFCSPKACHCDVIKERVENEVVTSFDQ